MSVILTVREAVGVSLANPTGTESYYKGSKSRAGVRVAELTPLATAILDRVPSDLVKISKFFKIVFPPLNSYPSLIYF